MAEPLLSSLCRICHTNPPKYRCPRCSSQTCSLTCSKRHKLWSDCSGARDPTAYKPMRELATPAGIDHDYNFISKIERGIERSDRLLVEEKGLVDRKELIGRDDGRRWRAQYHHSGGDTLLEKALQRAGVIVDKAPKGMRRNIDNSTNWSKHNKCINWQIEWIKDDGRHIMGKGLEINSVGNTYAALLVEQRRAAMTPAEKRQDKKRKAAELQKIAGKRPKLDPSALGLLMQSFTLQNPGSSAWDQVVNPPSEEPDITDPDTDLAAGRSIEGIPTSHHYYLHRPHTPSSLPRVLIPLSSPEPLRALLQNRVVLEFPTIYALHSPPTSLPEGFMLEDAYLRRQQSGSWGPSGGGGGGGGGIVIGEEREEEEEEEDVDMDEGEI